MRIPTAPRVRVNQPWSAASSMVSIGATAPPTLAARNSAGSSMAPKWRPMKIIGPPEANASSMTSGVSTIRRSSRSAAWMAGVRATSR